MRGWITGTDGRERPATDVVVLDALVWFATRAPVRPGACRVELASGRTLDVRVVGCFADAGRAGAWRCTATVDERTTSLRPAPRPTRAA